MKNEKQRVFLKLFYALLASAITTQSFSQEKEIITITSEDVNSIKKKFDEDVLVYKVQQQEVNEYVHKKEYGYLFG